MIFPQLRHQRPVYFNLNENYEDWLKEQGITELPLVSPALDPDVSQQIVSRFHRRNNCVWSWGGRFEDRSSVWRGNYLDKDKKYLHLGDDYNAPAGTLVACDYVAQVVEVSNDHPEPGGWGTRVMLYHPQLKVVVIYAHLASDINARVGDTILPFKPFAKVGSPRENGGWYPHVHVQPMTMHAYHYFRGHPDELDGYGFPNKIEEYRKLFPSSQDYVRTFAP